MGSDGGGGHTQAHPTGTQGYGGVILTRMVLCRFELTLLNISLPTMVAMVGKTRAPHRILVADTWSARGLASAGIRGTGQPIPGWGGGGGL